MMALFSFMRARGARVELVCDINSATVGAAVVSHTRAKTTIHHTVRTPIHYTDETGAESLGAAVSAALTQALTEALDALMHTTQNREFTVRGIVHAPWAHSRSQHTHTQLDEPTVVTKELLQDIVARTLGQHPQSGRRVFERHVTRVELNGYATLAPYGKDAHTVHVSAIESSIAEPVYAAIQRAFKSVVPEQTVHLDAFVYALTSLKDILRTEDAYTVADIGGEYTSLTMMRNDAIVDTTSLAFGTEHLVRAVARDDADALAAARSEIALYLSDTCTPSQCRSIEQALAPAQHSWQEMFLKGLERISHNHRLPNAVYVFVNAQYVPWFAKALALPEGAPYTITGKPLKPYMPYTQLHDHQITYAQGVKPDTLLMLAALAGRV